MDSIYSYETLYYSEYLSTIKTSKIKIINIDKRQLTYNLYK